MIDYLSEDIFDLIYKVYLRKFSKYVCLIFITYFILNVNISNIIIYIKTNLLLNQLIKFENDKNDDIESEINKFLWY